MREFTWELVSAGKTLAWLQSSHYHTQKKNYKNPWQKAKRHILFVFQELPYNQGTDEGEITCVFVCVYSLTLCQVTSTTETEGLSSFNSEKNSVLLNLDNRVYPSSTAWDLECQKCLSSRYCVYASLPYFNLVIQPCWHTVSGCASHVPSEYFFHPFLLCRFAQELRKCCTWPFQKGKAIALFMPQISQISKKLVLLCFNRARNK